MAASLSSFRFGEPSAGYSSQPGSSSHVSPGAGAGRRITSPSLSHSIGPVPILSLPWYTMPRVAITVRFVVCRIASASSRPPSSNVYPPPQSISQIFAPGEILPATYFAKSSVETNSLLWSTMFLAGSWCTTTMATPGSLGRDTAAANSAGVSYPDGMYKTLFRSSTPNLSSSAVNRSSGRSPV